MPDDAAYHKLNELILKLSEHYGTPKFEPHVTLLSGIQMPKEEAMAIVKKMASDNPVPEVRLSKIGYLDVFYRCLFFRTAEKTTLLALREKAKLAFGDTQIEPYVPHLSFLYGDLPRFTKENIILEIGEHFSMKFTLPTLRLIKTQLTPEEWEVVGEERFAQ